MRKKKFALGEFNLSQEQVITFDTNILIFLFAPVEYSGKYKAYEEFYQKVQNAKAKLIISSIQISEFVNRCIRIQFDLYKKDEGQPDMDFHMTLMMRYW